MGFVIMTIMKFFKISVLLAATTTSALPRLGCTFQPYGPAVLRGQNVLIQPALAPVQIAPVVNGQPAPLAGLTQAIGAIPGPQAQAAATVGLPLVAEPAVTTPAQGQHADPATDDFMAQLQAAVNERGEVSPEAMARAAQLAGMEGCDLSSSDGSRIPAGTIGMLVAVCGIIGVIMSNEQARGYLQRIVQSMSSSAGQAVPTLAQAIGVVQQDQPRRGFFGRMKGHFYDFLSNIDG